MGFLLVFGLFGHEVWLFAGLVLFFFFFSVWVFLFVLFAFFCYKTNMTDLGAKHYVN